jgi:hypothetical protein
MLASQGVKKTAAERALAALAEQRKITCKEFGKTKLYIPLQEGLPMLEPAEKAELQTRIAALEEQYKHADQAVAALKKQVSAATSTLTVEGLQAAVAAAKRELNLLNEELVARQNGGPLISPDQVLSMENAFKGMMDAWTKHRRQFRAVWDAVSVIQPRAVGYLDLQRWVEVPPFLPPPSLRADLTTVHAIIRIIILLCRYRSTWKATRQTFLPKLGWKRMRRWARCYPYTNSCYLNIRRHACKPFCMLHAKRILGRTIAAICNWHSLTNRKHAYTGACCTVDIGCLHYSFDIFERKGSSVFDAPLLACPLLCTASSAALPGHACTTRAIASAQSLLHSPRSSMQFFHSNSPSATLPASSLFIVLPRNCSIAWNKSSICGPNGPEIIPDSSCMSSESSANQTKEPRGMPGMEKMVCMMAMEATW